MKGLMRSPAAASPRTVAHIQARGRHQRVAAYLTTCGQDRPTPSPPSPSAQNCIPDIQELEHEHREQNNTYHLVCLVQLHLDPPQRGLALLALDVLRIAVELAADAVDDLLEVGLVRVEEGRGGAVHRCC